MSPRVRSPLVLLPLLALAVIALPAAPATADEARPGRVIVGLEEGLPAGASVEALDAVPPAVESAAIGDVAPIGDAAVVIDVDDVADAVAELGAADGVAFVEEDQRLVPLEAPDDPSFGTQWALANTGQSGGTPGADIGALDAWALGTDATGTVVVVQDTGVDADHPDLAAAMWTNDGTLFGCAAGTHGYNQFSDTCATGEDPDGHGTHVAGTVGAVTDNGIGVAGVAPGVQLMDLGFLGPDGGWTSDAVSSFAHAVDAVQAGVDVRVVNASWGGGGWSTALRDAIRAAGDAGITVVAAAGNDGVDVDASPQYPCAYDLPNVICVAATTRHDALASYSNTGDVSVDLAAPGSSIASTVVGGSYGAMSGTSMATPHVSGVAAMVAACTDGSPATVRAALLAGVEPLPGLQGAVATGGRLHAPTALEAADCGAPTDPGAPGPAVIGPAAPAVSWDDGRHVRTVLQSSAPGTAWWADVPTEPGATSVAMGPAEEGTVDLRVVAVDGDGVVTATSPTTPGVVIDFTPPGTPLVAPAEDEPPVVVDGTRWLAAGADVVLTAADPDLPDGTSGSGIDPAQLSRTITSHGPVAVEATDRAGNSSPRAATDLAVDAAAPAVEFASCPSTAVQGSTVTIDVTASDLGSGLAVDPSGTLTVSTTTAGTTTTSATAADRVGLTTTATCTTTVTSPTSGGGGGGGGGGAPAPTAPAPEPESPEPEAPDTPGDPPPDEPDSPADGTPDPSVQGPGGPLGPPPAVIDAPTAALAATTVSRHRFADHTERSSTAQVAQDPAPAADGPRLAAHAVVARDDAFADALAGATLSADGPLLLTGRDGLSADVADELRRILAPGAVVHLLGGESALPAHIADAVRALGFSPVRLAGPSRVETALAVADRVAALHGPPVQVLVARADGPAGDPTAAWADAVTAGAHGAAAHAPVLLTPTADLHPAVAAWLSRTDAEVVLLGGEVALSAAVADALPGAARLAAPDRAATAVAVATQLWGLPLPLSRALAIDGWDPSGWAYGLVAAGLAADLSAPLLVIGDVLPPATAAVLGCTQTTVLAAGGSVPDDVLATVEAAACGGG